MHIYVYTIYIYICIKRSIPQEKWFTLVLRNIMKQEIQLYFMEEEQTSSLGTRGKPERNMSTKHYNRPPPFDSQLAIAKGFTMC